MRKWVDKYLCELAYTDANVRLLIADVGEFPRFKESHPDKFINVGVSESNCINVAAGMSSTGLRVFVYGVSSFFLYRAFEQFKYSISYWQQPVTFIGVGFGWKYHNIGNGHFTPDDIALCRIIPDMRILTPYCLSQLKKQLWEREYNAAKYIRITANIVDEYYAFNSLGHEDSTDVILSYGEMAHVAIAVANIILKTQYIRIELLSDITEDNIKKIAYKLRGRRVITIEDQCYHGSVACELLRNGVFPVKSFLLPTKPLGIADSRESLLKKYNLDVDSIVENFIV